MGYTFFKKFEEQSGPSNALLPCFDKSCIIQVPYDLQNDNQHLTLFNSIQIIENRHLIEDLRQKVFSQKQKKHLIYMLNPARE